MAARSNLRNSLSSVVEVMENVLHRVTGLDDFARRLVIYYTLATHALKHLKTFPLLVLKGPMGTGKSSCLEVIARLAYQPIQFSLRGRTLPTIRDKLAECHDGTAIIEEADQAWKDAVFECMLSDRYQRNTAQTALKESDGDGGWVTAQSVCFGATVLHRRLPFVDRALDGRSVFVRFKAIHDRKYSSLEECAAEMENAQELVKRLAFALPKIEGFPDIAARIIDSYRPLLAVAQICQDAKFLSTMKDRLNLATLELKQAQSLEPDGMVLRALIDRLIQGKNVLDFSRNIKVGDVAQAVWDNERVSLRPQQVAPFLRDLGFKTKESHGVTVVEPSAVALVKACGECGYEDDSIAALRTQLLAGREGRAGGPVPASTVQPRPRPHGEKNLPALPALPGAKARPPSDNRASGKQRITRTPSNAELPRRYRKPG
jgi:hypothetical protein